MFIVTVANAVLANWRFPPVIGAEDAFLEFITRVKADILPFEHRDWKLTFFPTTFEGVASLLPAAAKNFSSAGALLR
jgi:hypothetical protein